MTKYKFISMFVLLFIFMQLSCGSKDAEDKPYIRENACDSINKIDALVQDIVSRDSIYILIRGDSIKTKHLLSNDFIKPGKVFKGPDSLIIISINKDTTRTKDISLLYFYDATFSEDTTTAFLKVAYIPLAIKPVVETVLKYKFDKISCKWIMEYKKRGFY